MVRAMSRTKTIAVSRQRLVAGMHAAYSHGLPISQALPEIFGRWLQRHERAKELPLSSKGEAPYVDIPLTLGESVWSRYEALAMRFEVPVETIFAIALVGWLDENEGTQR